MNFGVVKKVLPRSLLGRSLLILVVPVLLIQVITTYIFFDRHWEKMTARLAFAVAGEISMIAGQIEENPSPENVRKISGYAARSLQFLISYEPGVTLEGQPAPSGGRTVITVPLAKAMDEQVRRPRLIDADAQEKWVETAVALKGGLLRVSVPQRRLFSTSGYIFLLWMIGVSLALLAIAVLFMRNQVRPIRRLAVAADRIGRGMDIPASFKPEGAWEVRQASKALIDMNERIRRQIQQRTAMLAGVSHDLRTPLTRMKLQVAMMGDSPDAGALKSDLDDMQRMVDAYLDFVRGQGDEPLERVDLRVLLERVAAGARRLGKTVEQPGVEGDMQVQLRPVAFERCIGNLVGNAAKYADRIWIAARREDGRLVVTVDDDGPGIPQDKLEDVFRPFYRLEESRNAETGGIGLGLPIVQDVVHSHGGKIRLEKSARGGVRAVIELPA